jgi:acetyltransferase-like isoleucine patch superfamily enzyme
MNEILYQLRYVIPIWFVGLVTNWLPDNRITVRIRGMLIAKILKQCGANFQMAKDVTILSPDRLVIGDNVYLAKGIWLSALGGLVIEDNVVIAPYCVIVSSVHGFKDGSVRKGGTIVKGKTKIGSGSWLASHVTVSAGAVIGKGNIICANSVVTKNFDDNLVIGGVPANIIKKRIDSPGTIYKRSQVEI